MTDMLCSPPRLDDVFRANRDKGQLAVATDAEVAALTGPLEPIPLHYTLRHWTILALHLDLAGQQVTSYRLIGRLYDGTPWITSEIQRLDLNVGRIQTRNSTCAVAGPSAPETEIDYPFLCTALHRLRIGPYFGVPEFVA